MNMAETGAEAPELQSPLAELSHDVLFSILAFCSPKDVLRLGQTSRLMRNRESTDALLWRSLARRNFQTIERAFATLDAMFQSDGRTRSPVVADAQHNWFRMLFLRVLSTYGKNLGWWISDRPFVGELMKASLEISRDHGTDSEPVVAISFKKLRVENTADPWIVTCGSVVVGPDNMPLFATQAPSTVSENSSIIAGSWVALTPVTVNLLAERVTGTEIFHISVPEGILPRWTDTQGNGNAGVLANLKPILVCRGPYVLKRNKTTVVTPTSGQSSSSSVSAVTDAFAGLNVDEKRNDHPAEMRYYEGLYDSAKGGSGRQAATDLFNPSFISSASHFALDCAFSCHSYISHYQAAPEAINDVRPGDVGLMFDPSSLAGQANVHQQGAEGDLLEDFEEEEDDGSDAASQVEEETPTSTLPPDNPEALAALRPVSKPPQPVLPPHVPHAPLRTPRGPVFPPRYFPLRLQQPIPRRFLRAGAGAPQPGEEGWEPEQLTGLWISTYRTRPPAFLSIQIRDIGDSDGEPCRELQAHKLTGNPNVPRGKLSFTATLRPIPAGVRSSPVIDEDESGGVDVVYQHLPPPGVKEAIRIRGVKVKFPAKKQFATPAYRNSYFSASEMLVISNSEFCVYSLRHNHITRYKRIPTDF